MHLSLQMIGFHILLTRQHLIRIATNRIDLAIVHNKPVRMGTLPAGIRVGGEAGVHHGNRRLIVLILQIGEKGSQLSYQEHSLIYDRSAGQTDHISHIRGLFKSPPQNIKFPVKIQPLCHTSRFPDKSLHDTRHTFYRLMPQHCRYSRHFTPA